MKVLVSFVSDDVGEVFKQVYYQINNILFNNILSYMLELESWEFAIGIGITPLKGFSEVLPNIYTIIAMRDPMWEVG